MYEPRPEQRYAQLIATVYKARMTGGEDRLAGAIADLVEFIGRYTQFLKDEDLPLGLMLAYRETLSNRKKELTCLLPTDWRATSRLRDFEKGTQRLVQMSTDSREPEAGPTLVEERYNDLVLKIEHAKAIVVHGVNCLLLRDLANLVELVGPHPRFADRRDFPRASIDVYARATLYREVELLRQPDSWHTLGRRKALAAGKKLLRIDTTKVYTMLPGGHNLETAKVA